MLNDGGYMKKSAQDRFDEFRAEQHETRMAATAFVNASYNKYGSYNFACGYLQTMVNDLIAELPKKRREEYRAQLLKAAAGMSVIMEEV
jgi:hypothetical protein